MLNVPVIAVAAMPRSAIAPIGSGLTIIPTIVATKIANRCHALGWTPAGGGMNQMIVPMIKTLKRPIASPQLEIVAECLLLNTGPAAGTETGFIWIPFAAYTPAVVLINASHSIAGF